MFAAARSVRASGLNRRTPAADARARQAQLPTQSLVYYEKLYRSVLYVLPDTIISR